MNNVTDNAAFLEAIYAVTEDIWYVAYILLPIFLVMMITKSVGKSLLLNTSLSIDFGMIIRVVFYLLLLPFYVEIMDMISLTIAWVCDQLDPQTDVFVDLNNLSSYGESEKSDWDYIVDTVQEMGDGVVSFFDNPLLFFVTMTKSGLLFAVRKIINILRAIFIGILFAVGPLSFAMSALPNRSGLLNKWFTAYLNLQCWSIVIIILDKIFDTYANNLSEEGFSMFMFSGEFFNSLNAFIILVVYLISFLFIPWLTSFIVGSSDVGHIPGKIAQTVMAVQSAGASLATGAIAGASIKHATINRMANPVVSNPKSSFQKNVNNKVSRSSGRQRRR
ncbi:hypothetical protein [Chondrinema litorale]|uniref:hypothetical protein n=1 Tax=Chondrinema litorale TaxID=2994555 RepID=UPI00254328AB|nr:hypothetical protein [Chondrinema litorale]UZS00062.1 hypothetical protein OQ292_39675 [Chondrinema litorale]